MSHDYDLIVIGAGNAGQAAAGAAARAGWRVAIIESRDIGGTCPNRGCVPKKVLVAAAESLDLIARASAQHVEVTGARLDWSGLIARKRELIGGMPASMEKSLTGRGIDVLFGHGSFVGPTEVEVDGRRLSARKIVVATGARPRPLPLDGADLLVTSDELLELDELPESVVFVGGGVIAFELGHVLARAGARVTILEVADQALNGWDRDAVRAIIGETERIGIEVVTGMTVESVVAGGRGRRVTFDRDGESRTVDATLAVNAAGRIPAVDDLNLPAAGIEVKRSRVSRDRQLRSTDNGDVYFAGDLLPGVPQLSPLATYEGRIVGHNLTSDQPREPDYSVVPRALFTVPTLAAVGLSEAEAEEAGRAVEVKVNDMSGWLSARSYAERVAWAKVLVDKDDDTIVGAHLVGHGAADTIHLLAMAMRKAVTASELRDDLYVYPSFTNDLKFLV